MCPSIYGFRLSFWYLQTFGKWKYYNGILCCPDLCQRLYHILHNTWLCFRAKRNKMDTEAIKSRFNYVNCNLPSNIIFKPKQKRLKIACSVRKEYNCPIVDRVWNILTVRETLRQKRCFQFSYCERSIYAMYVVTFQQHLHMEYISHS